MTLQTEFNFVLPQGYVDRDGNLHREGTMRLATAMDEIAPLRDPRVRENQAYLVIILLSRVITRLGTLPAVSTYEIENLFSGDLAYLQRLYRQINEQGDSDRPGHMPRVLHTHRRGHFAPGGIVGYPLERLHEEVAYLAYYLHWQPEALLTMEHGDRRLWVAEVADIHRRAESQAHEAQV